MICKFENVRTIRRLMNGEMRITHIQVTAVEALGQLYACSLKMRARGKEDSAEILSVFCSQADETLKSLNQPYVDLYRPVRIDEVVGCQPRTYFEIWVDDLVASVKNTIKGGPVRGDGMSTEEQLSRTCQIVEDVITRDNPKL